MIKRPQRLESSRAPAAAGLREMGSAKLLIAGVAIVVVAQACGGGRSGSGSAGSSTPTSSQAAGRLRSPAKLAILSPSDGQVIHGSTLHPRLRLAGARVVPSTSGRIVPTKGYIHIYLDGKIVAIDYELPTVLHGIKPGRHRLKVEFVATNHLPFNPPVAANVSFLDKP